MNDLRNLVTSTHLRRLGACDEAVDWLQWRSNGTVRAGVPLEEVWGWLTRPQPGEFHFPRWDWVGYFVAATQPDVIHQLVGVGLDRLTVGRWADLDRVVLEWRAAAPWSAEQRAAYLGLLLVFREHLGEDRGGFLAPGEVRLYTTMHHLQDLLLRLYGVRSPRSGRWLPPHLRFQVGVYLDRLMSNGVRAEQDAVVEILARAYGVELEPLPVGEEVAPW